MSMDLTKLFCFTYPIGWDEIGVIATVIAVVVALAANQSSRKQLVKALEMQEQSKNVELLGQRINVIDSIQANVLVSETAIKLLFNKSVLSCYQTLKQQKVEYEAAKNDEATFFQAVDETKEFRKPDDDITSRISEYELFMERSDCPAKIFEEYKEYCKQNEQWWSETGLSDDRRIYNHAEIRERMIKATRDIEKTKNALMVAMGDYVASSIAPVSMK